MGFAPAMVPGAAVAPRASVSMETVADLKGLATSLNPAVGFWDPLKLAEAEFWDNTNEETIRLAAATMRRLMPTILGFSLKPILIVKCSLNSKDPKNFK